MRKQPLHLKIPCPQCGEAHELEREIARPEKLYILCPKEEKGFVFQVTNRMIERLVKAKYGKE